MSSILSMPRQRLPNETLTNILLLMDPWDVYPLRGVCTNFNNYIMRFIAPRVYLPMTTIFIRSEDSWIFHGANINTLSPPPTESDVGELPAHGGEVAPAARVSPSLPVGVDHRGQQFTFLSLRSQPGVAHISGSTPPLADFIPLHPEERNVIQAKLDYRVQVIVRIHTNYYRHVSLPSLVVDRDSDDLAMTLNWRELFNKTLNMPEDFRRLKDARAIPSKLWISDAVTWVDRPDSDMDSDDDEYMPSFHGSASEDSEGESGDDNISGGDDDLFGDLVIPPPEVFAGAEASEAFAAVVAGLPLTFSGAALEAAGAIIAAMPTAPASESEGEDFFDAIGDFVEEDIVGPVDVDEDDFRAPAELTEVLPGPAISVTHTGFTRYEDSTVAITERRRGYGLTLEDEEGDEFDIESEAGRHAFELARPEHGHYEDFTTPEEALAEAFEPRLISGLDLLPEYGSSPPSSHAEERRDRDHFEDEHEGFEGLARSIDVTSEEYMPGRPGSAMSISITSAPISSTRSRPKSRREDAPSTSPPAPAAADTSASTGTDERPRSTKAEADASVDLTPPSGSGSGGADADHEGEIHSPSEAVRKRRATRRERVRISIGGEDEVHVEGESFLQLEDSSSSQEQNTSSADIRPPKRTDIGIQAGPSVEHRAFGVQVSKLTAPIMMVKKLSGGPRPVLKALSFP